MRKMDNCSLLTISERKVYSFRYHLRRLLDNKIDVFGRNVFCRLTEHHLPVSFHVDSPACLAFVCAQKIENQSACFQYQRNTYRNHGDI